MLLLWFPLNLKTLRQQWTLDILMFLTMDIVSLAVGWGEDPPRETEKLLGTY